MATKQFSVDNTQRYDVTATDFCDQIQVFENYDSDTPPTADLIMYKPWGTSQGVSIPQGNIAVFEKGGGSFYTPGELAGQIQTDAGSITAAQVEREIVT